MDEREDLAEVLKAFHVDVADDGDPCYAWYSGTELAERLLASDWLAAHDAQVRAKALEDAEVWVVGQAAKAWDEGYLRGALDQESDIERADNPYHEG